MELKMYVSKGLKYISSLITLLVLSACGGGGGSNSYDLQDNEPGVVSISGAVQKGPFIIGTPVFVNKLDLFGNASENTIITEITDSVGSFQFNVSENSPVQILSNGYYFSELTGQISSGTLTLKAIYNASNENDQVAYVNILTHLINDRVLGLIKSGEVEVSIAISQAQLELISALIEVLPIDNLPNFNALSVYNISVENSIGNAYLLALSTAFYKYAEIKAEGLDSSADAQLSLILNQIAKDFAGDGLIQQANFIDDLTSALRKLNPKEITENLRLRSSIDYSEPLEIPDISIFFGLCAGSSDCMWSSAAPMPQSTRSHASAEYQEKIYVFGGVSSSDNEYGFETVDTAYTGVYSYDPESNEWSQKEPMPIGLFASTAHTVGDKIYVFGGYGNGGFINRVMEFDPVNNSWEQKSPMPTYRYLFMSEEINGNIYVIGGHGTIDNGPWESGKGWEYKSHVDIYNPQSDSWSSATPAPSTVSGGASCSNNTDIYIMGGYTGEAESHTYSYSVTNDSWTARSPALIGRSGHTCVSIGPDFFLIGGRNSLISSPEQLDAIEHYSTEMDAWRKVGFLPTARTSFSADAIGEKVYIMGGIGGESSGLQNVVEVIDTSMVEK